jgi:putative transposase
MPIRYQQKRLYQINNIDENNYSSIVWERKKKLDKMALLLSEGCSENVALESLDMKRSSYYRLKKNLATFGLAGLENSSKRPNNVRKATWTYAVEMRVYHLRKKYPLWGKEKITVMYKRKYDSNISESTIGRILTKLMKQGKINSVRCMFGQKEFKPRIFNNHAQRWKYGMKAKQPGELIQIDHMTTSVPKIGTIKTFNAVCPVTKYATYQAYKAATSNNAADFLDHLEKTLPFKIKSIQVDGGSEFMAEFEQACFIRKIPLFVLPPRKPQYNGNVERNNATLKYEFYAQYNRHPNLHHLRKNLQKFAVSYNSVRPHQALGLLTPKQFYEVIICEALKSQMC